MAEELGRTPLSVLACLLAGEVVDSPTKKHVELMPALTLVVGLADFRT